MTDTLLSSRATPFPESSKSGPIYICTRNDDLDAIIDKVPDNRKEDLVFLQNGMLSPYLKSKGLLLNTAGRIQSIANLASHPLDNQSSANKLTVFCIDIKLRSYIFRDS